MQNQKPQKNIAVQNFAKVSVVKAQAEDICRKHIYNIHTLIGGIYRKYFQQSGFGGGEQQIVSNFNCYTACILFSYLYEKNTASQCDIKSLLLQLFDCEAEILTQANGEQSVPLAIKTAIAVDIRHKSGFTQYIADRIYDIYTVLQELLETKAIHKKNEVLGGIMSFAALQGVDIR